MKSGRAGHVTVLSTTRPAVMPRREACYGPAAGLDARPELADIGRLGRRLMRRAVTAARAEDSSVQSLLTGHLGADAAASPVASGSWPAYDQVNVQAGRLAGGAGARVPAGRADPVPAP